MSDKRTTIVVAGDNGIGEWGEKSTEYMIKKYREHAQYLMEKSQRILSEPDSAFQIELVRGVHVEHTLMPTSQPLISRTFSA